VGINFKQKQKIKKNMKYFIDTEFLEGIQTKRFLGIPYSKTKPTIDLISIGIVSEDNKEYYAISKEFNLKEAWNRFQIKDYELSIKKEYWLRENVLKPIYFDLLEIGNIYGDERNRWSFSYSNLKRLLKWYGKTNKQIAEEIKEFVYKGNECSKNLELWGENSSIKFYGYYADYDWVAFSWLFGKMINLPDGFPMYCIDLKQELDGKLRNLNEFQIQDIKDGKVTTLHGNIYPKQTNEHHALSDARWNLELYKFLHTYYQRISRK
jgi:hypothetical protein